MPSMAAAPVAGRSLAKRSTIAVSLHPIAQRAQATLAKRLITRVSILYNDNLNEVKCGDEEEENMGLFDKKKGDVKAPTQQADDEAGYYDSPQETVSLSDTRS